MRVLCFYSLVGPSCLDRKLNLPDIRDGMQARNLKRLRLRCYYKTSECAYGIECNRDNDYDNAPMMIMAMIGIVMMTTND